MKYTSSAVVAALFASTAQAIKVKGGPDVYGPNGENYQNDSGNYDLSRIGIDITEKGKGPSCDPATWATFHWKSMIGDGRVVDDSRESGSGQPRQITVGNHDGFKCWEFAFPHLREGDIATLKCPSYYAYGGAHTISPVSDFVIPLNSDVTFEVEMIKCGSNPVYQDVSANQQPHTTTLQPDRCFNLRSYHEQGSGNTDFVMTTVDDNGMRRLAIEHFQRDDKDQEWYYNEKDHSIFNGAHPDLRVDTRGPKQQIILAAKDSSKAQSGFDYTAADQLMTSDGFPFTVDHDTNYVRYAGNLGGVPQSWHVEYCKGEKWVKSAADLGYTKGWHGKYWFFPNYTGGNGYDTSGPLNFENKSDVINFPRDRFFTAQQRGFPSNKFAAEWTGKIQINNSGDYTFQTISDDGSRLWINDQKIVENWGLHGRRAREGAIFLGVGWHDAKVTFYENGGGANCVVKYKGQDTEDNFSLLGAWGTDVIA